MINEQNRAMMAQYKRRKTDNNPDPEVEQMIVMGRALAIVVGILLAFVIGWGYGAIYG